LYETIRKTGGWANWHMEIVNFFNCKDHYEARLKEQEYFVSLNATLNSIEPLSRSKSEEVIPKKKVVKIVKEICIPTTDTSEKKKTKYTCDCCNYTTIKSFQYKNHLLTPKHKNNENNNENQIKREYKYTCEKCRFKCSKNSEYIRHMNTTKHKMIHNDIQICAPKRSNTEKYNCESCIFTCANKSEYDRHIKTKKHLKNTDQIKTESNHTCVCGSVYKYASGYYRHKKNCNYVPPPSIEEQPILESQPQTVSCDYNLIEIIKILVKDNQEMRISMMAQHNTIIEQNK
jgi:hypothetical protein